MHEPDRHWPRPSTLLTGFVLVQYLAAGLLFLPGAQAVRPLIRALPYVSGLAVLLFAVWCYPARQRAPGRVWLIVSFAIMGFGLVLPDANPICGLAQIVFQLSIAAPLFWMERLPCGQKQLNRLLVIVGLLNGASALLGIGQVFYPDQLQPPEFTSLGLNQDPRLLEAMSFMGPDGQMILRPCGLSDQPGGAAASGAIAALIGMMLVMRPGLPLLGRGLFAFLAGSGILCLYLTQVRSLLMMTILASAAMIFFLIKQGRPRAAVVLLGSGIAMVVGMFVLASQIGGDSVFERFMVVIDTGVGDSFQQSRGIFLEYTLTEMLDEYPLGAGAGRQGMMYIYFSPLEADPSPSIYVEIQMTGWLVDGGLPLILCYLGAIAAAMWGIFRLAIDRRYPNLAYNAAIVFCFDLFIVGQSFAGPSFNSYLGAQFWFLNGLIFAVARSQVAARRATAAPKVVERPLFATVGAV